MLLACFFDDCDPEPGHVPNPSSYVCNNPCIQFAVNFTELIMTDESQKIQEIWQGDISTTDGALQLLILIDYLAVWARGIYRPRILQQLTTIAEGDIYDQDVDILSTMNAPSDAETGSNVTNETITNIQTRLDELTSAQGESSEMGSISE